MSFLHLPPGRLEITGHRGNPVQAPENTLASLREGIAAGADALEWDVRICRTGEAVLVHDETVDRTTNGAGPVVDFSLAELRALDAGSWFSERYAGERIPTLHEALRMARGAGLPVYCEVKALRGDEEAKGMVEALRATGMEARTVVISLLPGILQAFRVVAPSLRLAWVVAREQEMEPALEWVRGGRNRVIAPSAELLLADPARTRALVVEGLPLGTWTVDEVDRAEALVGLGVRRITSNRVETLVAWARGIEPVG